MLAANNPKPTRQRAASANPKGIASSSPRLRGTSYLGSASPNGNQPQRGCDQNRSIGVATNLPQPRCGCSRFATFTQGRRWHANLGLEAAIPLGLFAPERDSISSHRHALAPSMNPNGIPSQSPGLAHRANPGKTGGTDTTPTGLWRTSRATAEMEVAATPLGLLPFADVDPG